MPSTDPIDMLVEIAQATMARMNDEYEVGDREAFVLGRINGICCRIPEVVTRLAEEEEHV